MREDLSQESLRRLADRWSPSRDAGHRFKIHRDTSDFFRID